MERAQAGGSTPGLLAGNGCRVWGSFFCQWYLLKSSPCSDKRLAKDMDTERGASWTEGFQLKGEGARGRAMRWKLSKYFIYVYETSKVKVLGIIKKACTQNTVNFIMYKFQCEFLK